MIAADVKEFCKQQNLTYKQLAEKIGMTEGSLKVAITTDKFSSQTIQSINLLKENQKLQTELADFKILSEIIKKISNN